MEEVIYIERVDSIPVVLQISTGLLFTVEDDFIEEIRNKLYVANENLIDQYNGP